MAALVGITLGPKSKSVLIQKQWGAPIVCNDGVTIAKEIDLTDAAENLGAQMLRQAAEKTGDLVGDGDGTCPATILAHAACRGRTQCHRRCQRYRYQTRVRSCAPGGGR